MNSVVLAGGALVVIFAAADILRLEVQAHKRRETIVGIVGRLAMVAAMLGWLVMWFTQEPIWSAGPRSCAAFSSIELKGHVYRTCSYLVHRYQTGEWTFYGGLLAFGVCIGITKLLKRQP